MPQDNITKQLIINQLTKEQYSELVNTSQLSNSELYVITDDNHYTEAEIITLLSTKQDKLVVGEGVEITEDNIITIDLTNIYTKDELDGKLADKADLVASGYSIIYEDEKLTLKNILGEEISSVIIKSVPKTDDITINFNEQNQIQSIGEITKNGQPKYTWIGTQEEYDIDFESGIIDEYTECLITDTEAEGITPIVQFEAPTKLSDLANDMDFTTNSVVQEIKSELEAKIGEPIDNNNLVHKTGTETINGFKTFTEEITIQNGDTKGRISHKNTTSDTPSITDGYIEFGENTLKYGKESEQGLLYHTSNDIFHSGNLVAGENIAFIEKDGVYTINGQAGGGTGGTTVFVDDETIIKDEQQVITTVGVKSKNDTVLYDWVGTLEEYNSGVANGSIQPNWICWVTDDTINDFDFDKQANTDLSNLSEIGEKHFLNKQQITNCIKEIPQRIKLELSNGALTLKKGSIVTVPNGFESNGTTPKFDYVTVQNDLLFGFLDTQSGEYILECNYDGTSVGWAQLKHAGSGTSTEVTTGHYYRTDLNKIYYQNNTSSTYNAFPLGIVILEAGVPTLKQVFNGIGFIGSTIWLDKDVKLLVGDGRNDDGTLNNLEIKRATLIRVDVANWGNQNDGVLIYTDAFASRDYTFALNFQNIERFTNPTYNQHYKYDEQNNKWYFRNGADSDYKEVRLTFLAKNIELENGIVKSLPNYEAFRAADYQEVVKKSGDTINGSLFIESSNNNYGYIVKNTDYAYDELPSENHSLGTYNIVDKNNTWTTLFGFEKYTDGRNLAKVQVRGVDGTQARMQVWVDKSGNSFCSFPICTAKATTTSSASSSKIAVVVQNYVSGTSWYRIWSDGWIEQGGRATMPTPVTFLKAFSNTNYTVTVTLKDNPAVAAYENITAGSLTKTGFTPSQHVWQHPVIWYACGY